MTSGLHHVTLITRKVQANVDFYAGFLGLRLVKRTGGYKDARQLHLFYGDAQGSPEKAAPSACASKRATASTSATPAASGRLFQELAPPITVQGR